MDGRMEESLEDDTIWHPMVQPAKCQLRPTLKEQNPVDLVQQLRLRKDQNTKLLGQLYVKSR